MSREGRRERKNISRILRVCLYLALLLALLALAAIHLLEPTRLGAAAQRALKSALGVEVHIGKTRLDFRQGIGVSLEDVMIQGDSDLSTPLKAEEVFLGLEFTPLLQRELVWRSIRIYKPIIDVGRASNGEWLLPVVSRKNRGKESSGEGGRASGAAGFFVKRIVVQNGTMQFHDQARPGGPLKLKVRNLQVDARNLAFGRHMQLLLSALVDQPKDTAQITLETEIHLPDELDLSKIQIDGRLKIKDLWGDLFFPYYSRYVPMKHIGGKVTLDGTYRGNLAGIFHTVSKVVVEHAVFDYPDAFEQRLTAPRLEVDTDVSLDGRNLIIGPTVVRFPEGTVRARCSLFDLDPKKLRIDAAASTGKLRLEQVRKYIPTPILPPAVARLIRSIQSQGTFRIISGGTAGIVSNYPKMKSPEHWGMVWMQMALENGELEVPGLPKMSGIRGNLSLNSGKLEASYIQFDALGGQWTARGTVDSLYSRPELSLELEGDSDLVVAHEFALASNAGIFKKLKKDISSIRGLSSQKIKIHGELPKNGSIEIAGDVQFNKVSLETHLLPYPVKGASGTLSFDRQKVSWESIKGILGRSPFLTTGMLRNYSEKHPLIDASVVMSPDAHDIAPLIKKIKSVDLALEGTGKVDLQVIGSLDHLNVSGKIVMDKYRIAFLPWVDKPFGVGATFELRGSLINQKELIVERMNIQMADTIMTGRGDILWGKAPYVEIELPSIVVELSSLAPLIPTAGRFQPSGRITGRLTYSHWLKGKRNFLLSKNGSIEIAGDVQFNKVSLETHLLPHPVKGVSGTLSFDRQKVSWESIKGILGRSPFLTTGMLRNYSEKHPLIDASVVMSPDAHDIAPLIKKIKSVDLALEGTGKVDLQVIGSLDHLNVSGKIVMDKYRIAFLPWVDKPFGVGATFELRGSLINQKELIVERMNIQMADTIMTGRGDILWGKAPYVEIELPSIVVELSSLAPLIPTAGRFQPSGRITGRLTYSHWLKGKRNFLLGGEMSLQKVSLQLPWLAHPVTHLDGRISLKGDLLSFHQVSARVGGSDITMNGTVRAYDMPRAHLSFYSRRFSVDDFSSPDIPDKMPPVAASSETSNFLTNLEGEAHISMEVLNIRQVDLQSLAADLKIHNGILDIKKGTFRMGKGSLTIEGMANLVEAPRKTFQADMKVRDMDVSSTLRLLGGKRPFMTGTLDMDGSVQGTWAGHQPLADTLNGQISMNIRDGIVLKHALLSRLLSLLNVSQLFKGRLPDLTTKGLPFHRITADGTLVSGVINSNNFFLDGDAMKIAAAGQVDLGRNTIDMKMAVQPFLTVDYVLKKLPIIGSILTGQNKGLIAVYYLVKGNLREPEITPVPLQSLEKGVVGIFGRLLNTPADLLKKLNGMLKK